MSKIKTALITGSSRGIGAASAEKFASQGYNVAINYQKSKQQAQTLAKQLEAYGVKTTAIQADVSDKADCQRLLKETYNLLGGINVLVNNAGQLHSNPDKKQRTNMALTKLNGVEYLSDVVQAYKPKSIVNVSSMYCASNTAVPFATAYQAGVESLTKHFAQEYRGNTRVNCVRPGYTETDMLTDHMRGKPAQEQQAIREPLGRLIKPTEIAEVIYFVATNELLSGQTITADGGHTLRRNSL